MSTLQGLVDSGQEELKVLQTIMLLSSSTDTIKGETLTNVGTPLLLNIHIHVQVQCMMSNVPTTLVSGFH